MENVRVPVEIKAALLKIKAAERCDTTTEVGYDQMISKCASVYRLYTNLLINMNSEQILANKDSLFTIANRFEELLGESIRSTLDFNGPNRASA